MRRAVQLVNPRTSSTTSAIVLFAGSCFADQEQDSLGSIASKQDGAEPAPEQADIVGGKGELQQSIKLWAGSVRIPRDRRLGCARNRRG